MILRSKVQKPFKLAMICRSFVETVTPALRLLNDQTPRSSDFPRKIARFEVFAGLRDMSNAPLGAFDSCLQRSNPYHKSGAKQGFDPNIIV